MTTLDTAARRPGDTGEREFRRARVLIVEDEAIVADDLRQCLLDIGYEVAAQVASGERAIQMSVEAKPDVVLMDIVLGKGMDGISAAHCIRQQADVPVVFLTAHTDASTLNRAKLTEPFGYLVKPFEERSLHAAVEMALARHASEQRLRRVEAWFCPVFNTVGDAVIAVDPRGRVTFLNAVAQLLTGAELTESGQLTCEQVFRLADDTSKGAVEHPVRAVLRGESMSRLPEGLCVVANDGGRHRVEGAAVPLRDASGRIVRAVIAFRSLEARREIEREVRRLREELEATRSACRDQQDQDNRRMEFLLHAISHDLRSPLSVLRNYAELLDLDCREGLGDSGRELVAAMGRSILQIEDMIRGYVSLARSGQASGLARTVVDMNALVREVIAETCWLSGSRAIQFDCGDLPSIRGDRAMLRQVWVNLVSNAVKYSQNKLTARIRIASHREPRAVVFSVTDDGVGIDEQEMELLFHPFRRLSSSTGTPGLGLGLSVVRAIIEAHGGSITARSCPGFGTTFEFRLLSYHE